MKIPTTLVATAVILIAVVGGGTWWWRDAHTPGKYDDFATCLGDKGMKFYGAYWCPHCESQKKLFGKSAKKLPYTECAIPGSSDMKQVCKDSKIVSFPTWTGPGDERSEGESTLSALASRSGCTLPN